MKGAYVSIDALKEAIVEDNKYVLYNRDNNMSLLLIELGSCMSDFIATTLCCVQAALQSAWSAIVGLWRKFS